MDTWIDPATGDYTGARISRLENAVYLRLMTPLGSWWADTSLGSRLHELAREKDVPRIALLDDGRARAVEVSAEQPHDGRCLLHVVVTDATGTPYSYDHFVRVGA